MLRVLGYEECEVLANTTLLKELLKFVLETNVERLELVHASRSAQRSCDDGGRRPYLRANVEAAALPVGLSGQVRRELGVVVERQVLDDERTFLADCVHTHRTRNRRL